MKAACFEDLKKVVCREVADPRILRPTDAIVKVSLAGLCGSDLHVFYGRETGVDQYTVMGHELVGSVVEVGQAVKNIAVGDQYTVMGHELVGTVVEVGEAVKNIAVGDRVNAPFTTNCGDCFYCNQGMTARCESGQLFGWVQDGVGLQGGQSEFVRIGLADGTLKRIPESVSDASALLLGDNFSTGFYCAEMAEIKPGGTYAVIGCGTVGLLCIMAARHMGATNIYAIDPIAERRQQAESLGAQALDANESAIAEIKSQTGGRGADGVMELVGLPAAQKLAFEIIRPAGIMSVVGCHCTPDFAFSPIDAFDKNLTYRTGRCPARSYMDRLTDLVADGTFELDAFINRRFGVEEAETAYDVFSNRKEGCLKAAIEF